LGEIIPFIINRDASTTLKTSDEEVYFAELVWTVSAYSVKQTDFLKKTIPQGECSVSDRMILFLAFVLSQVPKSGPGAPIFRWLDYKIIRGQTERIEIMVETD
jgi:hypothetical protein